MKEVSCRALGIFLLRLEERRIAPDLLVEGTGVTLATLRNKNERIAWSDLVAIMRNCRQFFSDEEYVEIGRQFLRSPTIRFISIIARLLFSARDFYRWLNKADDGGGNQLFTCVVPSHREISEHEIEVELRLQDGYEMCHDFFVVSKGMYMEASRIVGLPAAEVVLTPLERGAKYRVLIPPGDPVLTRIRRTVFWPLTARAAARELKEAHETLKQRYEEIEAARLKVTRQATQLRTAHAVSSVIHGDLDLDRTLETIARALVEEAGFAGARVEIDTDVDGVQIRRTAEYARVDELSLVRTIRGSGGRRIGVVWVGLAGGHRENRRMLDVIVPTLSMALDNAVSYRVLEDYRRSLEKRVAERTTELENARDKLAETVERLEHAKSIRDRIFANLNHEIRSPLSLILLAVAHARTSGTTPRDLAAIEGAARRLLRLVDELLLLAEGREGELRLNVVRCNLESLVRDVVEAWRPAAEARSFTLVTVLEPCWAMVDPAAVERILANLLSNSMKYTPEAGRITVRLTARDGAANLEVEDNGIGIDADLRGRLFGRFERGEQAIKGNVCGSGLGLSLVKELVEAQGGAVVVDSAVGEGTAVRIELPLVAAGTGSGPAAKHLRPQDFGFGIDAPGAKSLYAPEGSAEATLLLAEDDPLLRDEIARLLATNYRVVVAKDGDEALRLAATHRPDLLVTDVAMPGIDGLELARRFLALPGNRVAPVLVLTAFGETRDRLAGFEAGVVDYIVKPFEPAELRARIRSQLTIRRLALGLLDAERLASLGRLSAGLAHELRNPANGIVNAVEPLRDALSPDCLSEGSAAAQLLDVIDHCSKQIAALSRQLLGFRRSAELERKPVPLETMLQRARATAARSLDGIEVRERLEYRGPLWCAEPLMQQVLANLLDNAIDAAGRGGWIELRSAVDQDKVVIELRDSGPGVPCELKPRLFEPFFTTKPPGKGTGLGLATSREIALRHGGTLEACGSGRETVFRLAIPLEAK